MKSIVLLLLLSLLSCNNQTLKNREKILKYPTRDYVTVGKIMDTVKLPYVIDVSYHQKRVVFIGCVHDVPPTHRQFTIIEKYFNELKPQVSFNEGGQISNSIHYSSTSEAIEKSGETGALKYFSDQAGIPMINGDLDAKTEFALTLKKVPKDQLFLYYLMERVVIPYHYGAYQHEDFETVFHRLIEKYFIKNGFPLSDKEKELPYFENLYVKETKKKFDINDIDLEAFDYINDHCISCAVGRISKMTRDGVLLSKIDAALNTYDRVLVTFGHGHALAIEPALKEIVTKKRN